MVSAGIVGGQSSRVGVASTPTAGENRKPRILGQPKREGEKSQRVFWDWRA